ncbi:septin-5-like isoform X1 [Branchiostoma lanceolatum]|uniref:septin-5-like isoform X1 n=1 Tax=Branchiostoma lanceolatum TaxID=7740 RepID=UPI0034557DF6
MSSRLRNPFRNPDRIPDPDAAMAHLRPAVPPKKEDDQAGQLIGFATLPDQVHRKSIKKGFEFTLIVVGETGLGKSTLINSLFLTDLYKDKVVPTAEERISKTVEIKKSTVEIEEKGVKLKLNVIDTPGFGDSLDCSDCWKQVADFIEAQFEQYFRDESGLNRKNITDNRVHCCLYFIPPYGHGLRPLDREFMKRLQDKVNIVPVIAKADTLTPAEVKKLKAKINEEIEKCEIKIYQFPDCDSDEDEEFKQQDNALKLDFRAEACIPFAVIGSNTVIEVKGRRVRGRVYPWGVVEVENQDHCDFVKLRNMLVRTHMQDLKDVTRDVHYENYRAQTLQRMNKAVFQRNKLKRDSSPDFANVQETDRIIQEKDEELRRMQEMLARMEQQLEEQKRQSTQTTPKHQLVI